MPRTNPTVVPNHAIQSEEHELEAVSPLATVQTAVGTIIA